MVRTPNKLQDAQFLSEKCIPIMRCTCLERNIRKAFYRYGTFVAQYPKLVMLGSVLLCFALGAGNMRVFTNVVQDVDYLFLPDRAPFRLEQKAVNNFLVAGWSNEFADNETLVGLESSQHRKEETFAPGKSLATWNVFVLITAKNLENILQPHYSQAVNNLINFIAEDIYITYNGTNVTFQDTCQQWSGRCFKSDHILFINRQIIKNEKNKYGTLTFPTWYAKTYVGGIYLGTSVGGVTSNSTTHELMTAKVWQMAFNLNGSTLGMREWMNKATKTLQYFESDLLEVYAANSDSMVEEIQKNSQVALPRFGATFLLLTTFAVICCFTVAQNTQHFAIDWVRSKPLLAIAGVTAVVMGMIAGVGLVLWCGSPITDLVAVMPFLVTSIGVDDMFLLLAAWRETSAKFTVAERIGQTLSEAGVAITITTVTDVLCFGAGAISPLRGVTLFSTYCATSLFFMYLFELTFLMAALVLLGHQEAAGVHCLSCGFYKPARTDSGTGGDKKQTQGRINVFLEEVYTPFILRRDVAACLFVFELLYLATSIYGCITMSQGFEYKSLILSSSVVKPFFTYRDFYFEEQGVQLTIIVNNATELWDPVVRRKVYAMVSAFENTEHTLGRESTDFWLLRYNASMNTLFQTSDLPDNKEDFLSFLKAFLLGAPRYHEDMVWTGERFRSDLLRYRFYVTLTHFRTGTEKMSTTHLMRRIASEHAEFNIITHTDEYRLADQFELVPFNTIQDIGIAMLCMFFISLLLIPNVLCSIFVSISIIFIDVGVIGYLSYWNVNLDPISMVAIIMSIGFAIDYSAHVAHGYVVAEGDTPAEKVRLTLSRIGWPVFQGAISTLLGVLALATVDAYMITTFFKSVFLVIVIGLMHALLILPVMLVYCLPKQCSPASNKQER